MLLEKIEKKMMSFYNKLFAVYKKTFSARLNTITTFWEDVRIFAYIVPMPDNLCITSV